jgi:quinolinate synthase
MQQLAPGKKLIAAPTAGVGASCESCAHCPWMAMNALHNLEKVLIKGDNEITVQPEIRDQAVKSVQRMLDFAAQHQISGALPGK